MDWTPSSVTFLGTIVTIFSSVIGLAVWMVKKSTARDTKSAEREAAVSDRFIEHLERSQREATEERAADRADRAREREEFLAALHEQSNAVGKLTQSVENLAEAVRSDLAPRLKAVEDKVGV